MVETKTRAVCILRPGELYQGIQGLTYARGFTAETVGARGICLTTATMPPGARGRAHYHDGIDTVGYIVAGTMTALYGERLEYALTAEAGDCFFIPAGLPHAPFNHSDAPCNFVVAHAAGDDQEGIVLLPELDAAPSPARR